MSTESKPWNDPAFLSRVQVRLDAPKGMLGPEERQMLYWLTNEGFSGRGQVVDAGAFIGASAFALAAGLRHRSYHLERTTRVHSYDFFSVVDEYVGHAISRDIRPIGLGEGYLDIFLDQTRPFSNLIVPYPGDFLKHRWNGDTIGVLFIDICKTRALNSHVLSEFFPHIVPGETLVVHQDFYHVWHPYIHVTMQYLKEYFTVESHRVVYQSKVYRSARSIPKAVLSKAIAYDFTASERLDLLNELADESPPPVRQMAQLIALYQRVLDRDAGGFKAGWRRFVDGYADAEGSFPKTELWGAEAGRVRAVAERLFGRAVA
jgi:hypothetical protein